MGRCGVTAGRHGERGIALVVTLLAMLLLATLGVSLVLTTSTETMIAASYRDSGEALHAAEAGLERALQDLFYADDWSLVLGSSDGLHALVPSTFLGHSLTPSLPDGRSLDVRRATNAVNCPQVAPPAATPCSSAQVQAFTPARPWGTNNPHWRLYAHGYVADLLPGRVESPFYVAVWTADDPADTDHDPTRDGGTGQLDLDGDGQVDATNPGAGLIQLRAEAFGPGGARRVIEATVARTGGSRSERGDTAQRGHDALGSGQHSGVVQAQGTALSELQPGDPQDFDNDVGETGLRVLSWRHVR